MWHPSPVTRVVFRGQRVHVKHDDVYHLAGNKMRKLWYFLQQNDAFYAKTHFVSWGGSQSNAMVAIAQLANAKRVPFTYFSRKLHLKDTVVEGNLLLAKALGMQHVQLESNAYRELVHSRNFASFVKKGVQNLPEPKWLYVPQGVAMPEAQEGTKMLAQELNEYVQTCTTSFSVVLPCGTGTTALYLAQHLHPDIALFAIPCVGDAAFLHDQFRQLVATDPSLHEHSVVLPRILVPKQKNRFGRVWWPLYHTYHEVLHETQLDVDLLYGAYVWYALFSDAAMLEHVLTCTTNNRQGTTNRQLLYLHTGGTSGNGTMLARYLRHTKSK